MADTVKLKREFLQLGKELGLEGKELSDFVAEEYAKASEKQAEKEEKEEREREREQEREREERDRQERERQADREHALKMKELELSHTGRSSPSLDSSQSTGNRTIDPALSFQLDTFTERAETIDLFLDRFENLATEYGLEKAKWNLKLSQSLRGDAYDTFNKLPLHKRQDYEELKTALLRRYELTEDAYRKKFRNMRKERNETFSQFVDRLESTLLKWIDLSPFQNTQEGLFQLIIAERLTDSMEPEVRRFIAEQGAKLVPELAGFGDRYLLARQHTAATKRPDKSIDHRPPRETQAQTPRWNGAAERPQRNNHSASDPQPKPRPRAYTNKYCHHCKMTNHNTSECRRKPSPRPQVISTAVTRDESPEHIAAGARHSSAPQTTWPVTDEVIVNNNKATCLYDTGLSYDCIVKEDLVDPSAITDQTITLQLADLNARPVTLKIATINIDSRYVKGVIKAAIMPKPAYDVILGCRYVFLGSPEHPQIVGAVTTRSQREEITDSASPQRNLEPGQLRTEQKDDPTLAQCFNKLSTSHSSPRAKEFFVRNGLLYRQSRKDHAQLVIPKGRRKQVLDMEHSILFSGHMGAGATMQRISAHYFWPGIHEDVTRYVRSCPQCQKSPTLSYVVPVTSGKMPITRTSRQRVATDAVGPLPLSKRTKQWKVKSTTCRQRTLSPLRNPHTAHQSHSYVNLTGNVTTRNNHEADYLSRFSSSEEISLPTVRSTRAVNCTRPNYSSLRFRADLKKN